MLVFATFKSPKGGKVRILTQLIFKELTVLKKLD